MSKLSRLINASFLPVVNRDQTIQSIKQTNGCLYYREDALVAEITEAFGLLFLIYTKKWGKVARLLLSRAWCARMYAWYVNSRLSIRMIEPFIKKHGIIMTDFEQPANGYQSFNEFFYRRLKPGARVISQDQSNLVAPADAKIFVIPNISTQDSFFVKQESFSLESFLGDKELAQEYEHGTMMIFRLAPYDYHRYHACVDGVFSNPRIIKGAYDSVNPLVYAAGHQPLMRNARHVITINSDRYGKLAMVVVGAMFVGSIVHTYQPGNVYSKGDEIGYFQFGGSTVVLLAQQGTVKPCTKLIEHSVQGYETAVLVGQKIGEIVSISTR